MAEVSSTADADIHSLQRFECFDKRVVVFLVAHSDAHIILVFQSVLIVAVLDKDIEIHEQAACEFLAGVFFSNLAEEIVGLTRDDAEERNVREARHEAFTFGYELLTRAVVILLIFTEDLHVEFRKTIDIPNAHIVLHPVDELFIAAGQNSEAQTWNAIALADALHYGQVGISLENLVVEQTIVAEVLTEIHETFIDNEEDASFLTPSGQAQHIDHWDEIAAGVIGVDK